jgi:hypothetical protein
MTSPTDAELDLRKVNFLKGDEDAFHFDALCGFHIVSPVFYLYLGTLVLDVDSILVHVLNVLFQLIGMRSSIQEYLLDAGIG